MGELLSTIAFVRHGMIAEDALTVVDASCIYYVCARGLLPLTSGTNIPVSLDVSLYCATEIDPFPETWKDLVNPDKNVGYISQEATS